MVVLTLEEIAKHTTEEDCWMIYKDKVYDITNYLDDHPGGVEIVMDVAGRDCTEEYDDVGHSEEANSMLIDFYIGDVGGEKQELKKPEMPKKKKAAVRTPVRDFQQESDNFIYIYAGIGVAIAALAYFRFRKV